jgi:deazaflavin-dependent oxidoreductase (nitroreductase family)
MAGSAQRLIGVVAGMPARRAGHLDRVPADVELHVPSISGASGRGCAVVEPLNAAGIRQPLAVAMRDERDLCELLKIAVAMQGRELAYVDPEAERGFLYRGYAALVGTRAMDWISRALAWRLDPILMRLSGGRLRFGLLLPTALLETRGARTGALRRNGVIYFHDGDRVVVVASKLGAATSRLAPQLRSNPLVRLGGRPFRAEVITDDAERARLWDLADRVFPPYATYRVRAATAGRVIPIVCLHPSSH